MTDLNGGMTQKELVQQIAADVRTIDGKLDGYISAHAAQHNADTAAAIVARSDPDSTPAGRSLTKQVLVNTDLLAAHERTINRLQGALALIGFLGLGGLVTAVAALLQKAQ